MSSSLHIGSISDDHVCALQASADEGGDNAENIENVADLVYSYLTIMLQHSMRHKDGWKVGNSGLKDKSKPRPNVHTMISKVLEQVDFSRDRT